MNNQSDLPPELKNALDSLRPVPARDQRVATRRRQAYLDKAGQLPARSGLRWFQPAPGFVRLAVTALLLIVLLAGTTATALAAQGSLPGSALYPLKTGMEDAQLAWTRDAADQFSLLQTFTARRFSEMDALVATNQTLPAALEERLEAHFQHMVRLSASMDDPALTQSLNGLQEMLQVRERLMTTNEGQPSDPVYARVRERVQEMNQLATAGLTDPNQFRWQYENQNNGEVTPAPGSGPGPDAGPGPEAGPGPDASITPGPGPGPDAGPGPDNPPMQTPVPTQGGPGGAPGEGQGYGGAPTDRPGSGMP